MDRLQGEGYRTEAREDGTGLTATILGQKVGFHIDDGLWLRLDEWTDQPCRRQWRDTEHRSLEGVLGQAVASLVIAAREKAERAAEWEAQRQKERERQEAERRREQERARVQALHDQADAFVLSERVRAYIKAIRDQAVKHGWSTDPSTPLGGWLAWAETQADADDPVRAWVIKSMGADGPPGGVD